MDVSVVIVNYKTAKLLVGAIDSVFDKTKGVSFEVIVVDNHSEDDSEWIVKKRYGGQVKYLSLMENIGFGRANNEGLKIATGRNVLFLNPDTLLMNNAIYVLSQYLDNDLRCGVVGGNLYDGDLQPTHSHSMLFPSIFNELDQASFRVLSKIIYGRNFQFNYMERPIKVAYICGADMMVRRSILDDVKGFDSDFFMYFEETELTFRIRMAGYSVFNVPDAKIVHLEGKSFILNEMREYRALCSRKIYYAKTHSKLYAAIIDKIFVAINALAYVTASLIRNSNFKFKIGQRLRLISRINKEFANRNNV